MRLMFDERKAKQLLSVLKGNTKELRRQVSIAVNAASKPVKRDLSNIIRQEIIIKADVAKNASNIRKMASITSLRSEVEVKKQKRFSLKEFKPKQNKKGVTYRISREQGRKVIPKAFMGPRPGSTAMRLRGHVFARKGKSRLPLVQMFGPSPWGVVAKHPEKVAKVAKAARIELAKQIRRRIRFLELKAAGKLRGKQPKDR